MAAKVLTVRLFMLKVARELVVRATALWDYLIFSAGVGVRVPITGDDRPIICFVGSQLPARIARLSKYLRRESDFCTLLVCSRFGFSPLLAEDHFENIVLFRNHWHLKRIVRSLKRVTIFHGFGPKSEASAIAHACTDVPFVFDMQDALACYHGLDSTYRYVRRDLPFERFLLANADAIVAHGLEPAAASRIHGIGRTSRPRNIFFGLYCDNDMFVDAVNTRSEGEIHICYVGGVAGSNRDDRQFGIIKFHSLIDCLSRQGVHLHIYPSPTSLSVDVEEYYRIDAANAYFHLHEPVPQSKLAFELQQYDFGILPFFVGQSGLRQEKMRFATTMKLFNYLEAGLPVIVSRDLEYQAWILSRGGVGIPITEPDVLNLRPLIEAIDYESLLSNVTTYREKLSLRKNVPRLVSLYRAVAPSLGPIPDRNEAGKGFAAAS